MGIETEYDDGPMVAQSAGDRSNLSVIVSHDLGDRTLIVVILLALVIGACGVVMGLNLSKQARLDDYSREIAAKVQVQNNQNSRIEAKLQEMSNERR